MFGIGHAVKEMQNGNRVARAGWNGKGMWLALCTGAVVTTERAPAATFNDAMTLPFVLMRTAQGDLVPWLCSQTDLLATDWELAT